MRLLVSLDPQIDLVKNNPQIRNRKMSKQESFDAGPYLNSGALLVSSRDKPGVLG